MLRNKIKETLTQVVLKKFGLKDAPDFSVEAPENTTHGDYASNIALILAKKLKKPPLDIARILDMELEKWSLANGIKTEIVAPGFINFFLDQKILGQNLKEIIKKKEKFGRVSLKNKTIVVEYSSPNIAKPLGIHHLRTTVIGQALVNLLRFNGYKVVSLSFPGDWGTQFGLLIAGYKRWGSAKKIKQNPIQELLKLYVMFSQAAQGNPELIEEGRQEFKKLEEGDQENLRLWKWFAQESYKDFNKVYKMLGTKIENTIGESYYEPELKKIIADALKRKIAQRGQDGSVVIPLPDSSVPEIIQKSDGATIYTTRELAAIRHRLKKWRADKILYVSDNRAMSHHLSQVFKSAVALGYAKKEQLEHIKFGAVLAPGGTKFATREGNLIPMQEVLNEAINRALKVVEKLNPQLSLKEKNKIAHIVGIGAVKFFDLSQHRLSDIVFDWDKMLNLKGASAPYIQYSYARLKSIIRKSKMTVTKFKPELIKEKTEIELMRHLVRFSETVNEAAQRYEPNKLADYLLKLAEKVNHLYETVPILSAEKDLRNTRLVLINGAAIIIKTGLGLLGIEVPERM